MTPKQCNDLSAKKERVLVNVINVDVGTMVFPALVTKLAVCVIVMTFLSCPVGRGVFW